MTKYNSSLYYNGAISYNGSDRDDAQSGIKRLQNYELYSNVLDKKIYRRIKEEEELVKIMAQVYYFYF